MTLQLPVDSVLLLVAVWIALAVNQPFLRAALQGRSWRDGSAWGLGLALVVAVAAIHVLLLAPLATRWTLKPLVAVSLTVAAGVSFYERQYGIHLDPAMLRNVLHTDWHEARELLGPALWLHLLVYAGLPLLLLWRTRIVVWPWWPALRMRLALLVGAAAVLVACVLVAFQPLSSLMRNHRELRYLVAPANVLWSLAVVARADAQAAQAPRRPIGLDARPGPGFAARQRPLLVVLVVGETVRSANWGLAGYARQTTPELAALAQTTALVDFARVQACGTDTETSLPCMFAPVGRRDYDEARIRGSESLLQLLARAGVGVTWRDNQSGCKGVCEGLPEQRVQDLAPPILCSEGRCLDEALLQGLPRTLPMVRGTQLLVLHMLGNHGPAYFRRYPPAFARFQPTCNDDELHRCTTEQIVNAYDNAVLYTDHLLAQLIGLLQAQAQTLDSALIYVSDHGESLGEHNLFLHGLPYALAPDVQKQVPMVMWFSPRLVTAEHLDLACLRTRARAPAAHDHLFHTLLGLLDVQTALYDPAWDLGAPCRRPDAR